MKPYPLSDDDIVPGEWEHKHMDSGVFARPAFQHRLSDADALWWTVDHLRLRTQTALLSRSHTATFGTSPQVESDRTLEPDGKASNPKDAAAFDRAPLHLLPIVAQIEWCLAHMEGGSKYGFWNFEVVGVRASVYIAAAARHLFKWASGEECETWVDPETQEVHQLAHHLGYVMACAAILIDAQSRKVLEDDRGPRHPALAAAFTRAGQVLRSLHKAFGDRKPRHYTIADTDQA